MSSHHASYAIVQYFPDPDRQEGINLGVLLFDVNRDRVISRFTDDFSRVTRAFAGVNRSFLGIAVEELQYRIARELEKQPSVETLKRFQSLRSNNFRLTPFLPTFAEDADQELQRLFDELVGENKKKARKQKVSVKLRVGLRKLKVLKHFDQHPEPVSLPRYNLKLKPDLAIRRETYNLIEAARFDEPELGLEQAGRHALASRALNNNLDMRLVVVGDFGDQPNGYYQAIKEDLEQANAQLFRIDYLGEFAQRFTLH